MTLRKGGSPGWTRPHDGALQSGRDFPGYRDLKHERTLEGERFSIIGFEGRLCCTARIVAAA